MHQRHMGRSHLQAVVTLALARALASCATGSRNAMTFYQELAWSPDGATIAYSATRVSRTRWEKERHGALSDADYDIYSMRADGLKVRRLTQSPKYDLWMSWSPDGKQIAFGSEREGAGHLFIMNADGSQARQLTNDNADHSNPSWSPDSRKLAYFANPSGAGQDKIFVTDLDDSSEPHPVADGVWPAWSPDGKSLIFGHKKTLYVMGLDESTPRKVAEKSEFGRFSPNGERIALVVGNFPDTQIYVMNVDGTALHRVTR
jgi:Tol biopolymer transport system component